MAESEENITRRKIYANSCVLPMNARKTDSKGPQNRRRSLSTTAILPVSVPKRDGMQTTGRDVVHEIDGIPDAGKQKISSDANEIPIVGNEVATESERKLADWKQRSSDSTGSNCISAVRKQMSSEADGIPIVQNQMSSDHAIPLVLNEVVLATEAGNLADGKQVSSGADGIPAVRKRMSFGARGTRANGNKVSPEDEETLAIQKQMSSEARSSGIPIVGRHVAQEAEVHLANGTQMPPEINGISCIGKQLSSDGDARCDSFYDDIRSDGLASSDGSDTFTNRSDGSSSSSGTRSGDGTAGTIRDVSSEPRDEIKEAFHLCDEDGVGTLTIQQFKRSIQAVGFNPTNGDIHHLITSNNIHENVRLGYRQYRLMMGKVYQDPVFTDHLTKLGHAIDEVYRSLGKDMDDNLTKDYLKHFIQTKGDDPLTDEEFEEVFTDLGGANEAAVTKFVRRFHWGLTMYNLGAFCYDKLYNFYYEITELMSLFSIE